MDFMQLVVVLLGIALIVVLVYLALTGKPVPDALKVVILIAIALLLLFCLVHAVGCRIPPVVPTPIR